MLSQAHTHKCVNGFTLAEVLVVVMILGLAAAIVIPTIGNTDDLQATSAARGIASTLLFAQTTAIASQEQCQVAFDLANNSYEVQDKDGNVMTDPVKHNAFRISFANHPELHNITIDSVDFDGSNIVWFDRLGAPYGGAIVASPPPLSVGTINISAGQESRTVSVEPVTGRIRVTE